MCVSQKSTISCLKSKSFGTFLKLCGITRHWPLAKNSIAVLENNKWVRTLIEFIVFSEFRESNKSMKYKLGSNERSCLTQVSCWCCDSILVSCTRGRRFEPCVIVKHRWVEISQKKCHSRR